MHRQWTEEKERAEVEGTKVLTLLALLVQKKVQTLTPDELLCQGVERAAAACLLY
jgi:hypothetical protein